MNNTHITTVKKKLHKLRFKKSKEHTYKSRYNVHYIYTVLNNTYEQIYTAVKCMHRDVFYIVLMQHVHNLGYSFSTTSVYAIDINS